MAAYLKDPYSPYWKNKTIAKPENLEIIHKDDFRNLYYNYQRFFRIKHDLKNIEKENNDISLINIEREKEQLVNIINECYKYENIKVNNNDIDGWQSHPTFNAELWIKIVVDNRIVATGIAEYDIECREVVLEWIQVVPDFQNSGYGEDIANLLLYRLKELGAKFATVSGNFNNLSNPETLYRRCGFTGKDIWYICKKYQ